MVGDVARRAGRISLHDQALEGREAGEREQEHDQQPESGDDGCSVERDVSGGVPVARDWSENPTGRFRRPSRRLRRLLTTWPTRPTSWTA